MRKLKPDELKQVDVERYVESLFTKNGCLAKYSESSLDIIIPIVLAFAAGELDWVKDIGRDDE